MEGRFAGIDLAAIQHENTLLKDAELRHEEAQARLQLQQRELKERLLWYSENQALLDDLAAQTQAKVRKCMAAASLPHGMGTALLLRPAFARAERPALTLVATSYSRTTPEASGWCALVSASARDFLARAA